MSAAGGVGIWGWIWMGLFLAVFLGIGLYGMRKTQTGEDFAVARNAYGPITLALAFAATAVVPTNLAKPAGAGHQITHFRVLQHRALQFAVALVGQVVAEEAREQRGLEETSFIG